MSRKTQEQRDYWGKLMGEAAVFLTGASDSQMRVQLFDVLDEFFNESCCWTETIKFMVVPDALDYPLVPLSGRIVRLEEVLDQNNVPQQAIMPEIGTVRFLYPYTQVQPMTAMVVKTVTDPFNCSPPNVPEWLLPSYGRGIMYGIIGHMMLMPGMPYSNPPLGQFYLGKFSNAINGAMVASVKANKIGAQNWAYPQQFAVTGQRGGVSTYNVLPTPR